MTSSSKSTVSIEDLPWEMIRELFKYLGTEDLAVCSMVNKRWHSVYATIEVHRLAVIGRHVDSVIEPLFPDPDRENLNCELSKWKYQNRRIEGTERCRPSIFRCLAKQPLLSNLKHLLLSGQSSEFDLDNKLNRFKQLVHLEINIQWLTGNVNLKLPKLKNLVFHNSNTYYDLSIDCPELSTLVYPGERNPFRQEKSKLEVKNPETIRMLEADLVGPELDPFQNVECLVTRGFWAISRTTLLSLPKLRELRFNRDIEFLFRFFLHDGSDAVDRLKLTLSEFVDEAKRLRGADFQFTFSGLQVTNVDQIDFALQAEVHEGRRRERVYRENVYMKNYHLIEPDALPFVRQVDYTRLLSCVTGEIPRCFSAKFTDIEKVEVHGVIEDADQLLWFLKSLRSLRRLRLEEIELGQEFYDQLPAAAPSLVSLYLEAKEPKKLKLDGMQLNFDFIGKLSHLSILNIMPALSLESLPSLIRWLGLLDCSFYVKLNGKDHWVRKGSEIWKVGHEQLLFGTKYPEKILEFFQCLGPAWSAPDRAVVYHL